MGEVCSDNRYEVLNIAKKKIIDGTNIESSPDEMKVLDQFLFRCWQMGWLRDIEQELDNKIKEPKPVDENDLEESGLVKYARSELKRLEDACETTDAREMQESIDENIVDLIKLFSDQGHSDFSGNYALNLFKRLSKWKPATAITGEDSEWHDIGTDINGEVLEQNTRYTGLFRNNHDNSTAHDIYEVVISDDGGITWFTSKICDKYRSKIEFPYMPLDTPREVYIEYTKFDEKTGEPDYESWIDITDNEVAKKRLRDKFNKSHSS